MVTIAMSNSAEHSKNTAWKIKNLAVTPKTPKHNLNKKICVNSQIYGWDVKN